MLPPDGGALAPHLEGPLALLASLSFRAGRWTTVTAVALDSLSRASRHILKLLGCSPWVVLDLMTSRSMASFAGLPGVDLEFFVN